MKSLFAAIILFTRLPLWRIVRVDKKQYAEILLYWPIVGFLTGATTWGTLYLASWVMPLLPACVIAVIARLLLTGALHEDGLADFFDGFGGGHDKAGILRIMKDSHIGSYGTIGLILYFILYVSLLSSFYSLALPGVIIGADVLSKLCTAVMINTLCPYGRREQSKSTLPQNPSLRICPGSPALPHRPLADVDSFLSFNPHPPYPYRLALVFQP